LEAGQVELPGGVGYHLSLEMTYGAGIDLDDRGAGFAQSLRIVVGREVANNDPCFGLPAKSTDGLAQEGGLARARGREDIQDQQPARAEEAAVPFGETVVLAQDRLAHLDNAALGDGGLLLMGEACVRMRMGMRAIMVFPVMMPRTMLMLVAVFMFVAVLVGMVMLMVVVMVVRMAVLVRMMVSTDPSRSLSRQTTSAITTHDLF
jgi:hypothetical protein